MELVDGGPLSEAIPQGRAAAREAAAHRHRSGRRDGGRAAARHHASRPEARQHHGHVVGTRQGARLRSRQGPRRDARRARPTIVTRMSRRATSPAKARSSARWPTCRPSRRKERPSIRARDIFSLGVVLHEMATGERPFKGDTNVSILSSILKDTPTPVTDSNPAAAGRPGADRPPLPGEGSVAALPDGRGSAERARRAEAGHVASGIVTAVRPAPRRSRVRDSGGLVAAVAGLAAAIAVAVRARSRQMAATVRAPRRSPSIACSA